MCRAKTLKLHTGLGMRLARQGEHRAGLTLLALALRQAVAMDAPVLEAKIRNSLALVFHMAGQPGRARRQMDRALTLTRASVGTDNGFFATLARNRDRMAEAA